MIDALRHAVVAHLEIVDRKVADERAVVAARGHLDFDEVRARAKRRRRLLRSYRRSNCNRRDRGKDGGLHS